MARIFINYRRDDIPGVAGRLFDYLALKYSRRELFMDVDAMKPGVDFAQQLDSQVSQCHVLLAVIGPRWLEARDRSGQRRLDGDKDYVRIELASALKRDIAVIPVLVDGAAMPAEEALPDDLKSLARRHALELRHTRFNSDADMIVQALDEVVPRSRVPWRFVAPGAAAAVIAAAAIFGPKLAVKLRAPVPIAANNAPASPSVPSAAELPVQPSGPAASPQPLPAPAPQAAAAPAATPATGFPPGFKLGEMRSGVVLRGSLFRMTEIPSDPANCQAACRADMHCVAWTYRQPAAAGQSAHCALKAVIPQEMADICCTSGIEREPPAPMREPPPVPAGVTGAVAGIEMEGGTYRYFGDATPETCQAECRAEGQCLAWDYVRPGVYGADARCFLKNKPPAQFASPCCIAGFERQVADTGAPAAAVSANPAPATGPAVRPAPRFNTNLLGSDYRNFVLAAGEWPLCQRACKDDNKCLSWSFVRPGVQGPNAHCWLKNKIPQATANPCCISGVERAEAK